MSEPEGSPPLKLRAADAADLDVVAACLQDALVAVDDIACQADERRFVLVANRFKWETTPGPRNAGATYERVLCGLSFEGVRGVQVRNLDLGAPAQFLDLLHLALGASAGDTPVVELTFAGDAAIRLEVEALECHVEDFGTPWPTQWCPAHETG